MKKSDSLLMIIDGNNLAHRARHTFQLSNHGVDVSVTYGFLKILQSLISKHKPTSVLVCFDGGTPDFRRQAVPSYKANRHKDEDPFAWEDFNRQMNELCDYALPMMGMLVVKKVGAEADDLMYHASRLYAGNSLIVTGDKDLLQAVGSNVNVLRPSKDNIIYTVLNFEELVGVPQWCYVGWRAIQGDGSDNIPGIPGIGEKTATKLFKDYEYSISNIVNAALGHHPTERLIGKIGENIAMCGWQRISQNILVMALYADRVGAKRAIVEAPYTPANKERVKKYFMRNGFMSLMESEFYGMISKLEEPVFSVKGVRLPVVAGRRVAYK